ncbi:MFS transporter [Shewanella sp. D64]|uniref:MFS transporter n=1 Tax=unclassified Shewanella TaxID=196818 RepID=UPI0022BA43F3|nr:MULTISPECIES: MFS transporter [unclassified Shewanella]MEC4727787.1 MFS transporter [Shewanella sp. D64]MEC4737550.1 MFS transporter [Shewanella sp. E94]WBJ97359.1 MFS transporter [Shewanella sp. MTB7]
MSVNNSQVIHIDNPVKQGHSLTVVHKGELRLIWGLSIASIIVYINLYLVQGILPLIADTFDVAVPQATLLLSVTSFSMAFSLLFYAVISDRVGRRIPLLISLYLLLLSDLLMMFVGDFTQLLALRLFQGALLAAVPAIAMAYFKDELSQGAMLKAGAIYIAANSLGGIAGRLIGGALSLHLHWQQVIGVILLLSLVGVVAVHCLLPSQSTNSGSLTLVASGEKPMSWLSSIQNDFRGFCLHLNDVKLRSIYLVGGLAFLVMVNQFSYIQLHLMSAPFNWGRFQVTLIFLCYLSGTFASFYSGSWIARFGRETVFRLALAAMFFGGLITLVDTSLAICLGFLMSSFGFFLLHSSCNAWVAQRAKVHRAKATALYLCCYYLGASLGGPYLMPFWQHWGWRGVVFASSLVLVLLAWVLFKLTRTISFEGASTKLAAS